MHRIKSYLLLLLLWCLAVGLVASCVHTPSAGRRLGANQSVITITLLHLNDIYEIDGVAGGQAGGLARVAALRRQLLAQNPHTFTVVAGDLFSPSAIGTARVDGKRLDGEQMVDVLNAMGLDFATFGNHEFDLQEGPFRNRLQESHFTWITSNVTDATGQLFPKTLPYKILTVTAAAGTVRIGLVGATVALGQETVQLVPCHPGSEASPQARYYHIHDPIEAIRQQVAALGPVDVLIALTHLNLEEDIRLAEAVPQLNLILGGHEHENWHVQRGPHFTPILKADANARTVYIHTLRYHTPTRKLEVTSRLQTITTQEPPADTALKTRIEAWTRKAFAAFRAQNLQPEAVIVHVTEALDGREASVRRGATNLTRLIADAMLRQATGAELALYNSGAIRLDDQLLPGPVTQYDVIRILPFGGELWAVEMQGELLDCVLQQGHANRGSGGFLQTANVTMDAEHTWRINGQPLEKSRFYRVAINDFLLSGREKGLAFLTLEHPGIKKPSKTIVSPDLRQVLIEQLRQRYGGR